MWRDIIRNADRKQLITWGLFLLFIVGVEIVSTTYLPEARKPLYDALGVRSYSGFLDGLLLMLGVQAILLMSQSLKIWVGQKLSFNLRTSLKDIVFFDWWTKSNKTYVTSPESRIADDVRVATETAVSIGLELFISAAISLGIIAHMLDKPKLLISALVYSAISMGLAMLFKNPIANARYKHLEKEGVFRNSLTRLSLGHSDVNDRDINYSWGILRGVYHSYIAVTRNYKLFAALQNIFMVAVPFMMLASDYFNGHGTLGDITSGVLSFDLLVLNMGIWVILFPQYTDTIVAYKRVRELHDGK